MSAANVNGTSFQETQFTNCKLMGLHFDHCNPFLLSVRFTNCSLNMATFYQCKLQKTIFSHCNLQEADCTEADFSNAVFQQCNLMHAVFDRTNLEKADLRTAVNFSIDPERNKLKKAKFAATALSGLLHKYDLIIE